MEISAQSDILSMIFGATVVVKVVLAILVIMSIISWTLIFYKLFLYFKVKKNIYNDLASFSASKDLVSALRTLKNRPGSRLYVIGAKAVSEIGCWNGPA